MMKLSDAAPLLGGDYSGSDLRFEAVITDTRKPAAGALFVALRGDHFDGHDFLAAAKSAGAVAAIVEAQRGFEAKQVGLSLLRVSDTRSALGALAQHWRRRFQIPLIAVSGSNGKTTVKEMIAAILRAEFGSESVLATAGNLNNDIGLPLTLLGLRAKHRAAVIEVGMNHPGETAQLAAIAGANIAVVNNAQHEHQEFMKSVQAVAEEHSALFAALPPDGCAVVNGDDAFAELWENVARPRRIIRFGLEHGATVTARYRMHAFGASLELNYGGRETPIEIAAAGVHSVRNALAAAAATLAGGVSLTAVKGGLEAFRPASGRLQRKTGRGGGLVIDDTYNANPDSVRAAIEVLRGLPAPRILVLGDMGEVGERGPEFHEEIGRFAKANGIDALFALGELTKLAVAGFGTGAVHFVSVEKLISLLETRLEQRPTILVKGSRFMRMERVVSALVENAAVASH